ncbi:hypothetical protein, partial [Streptococcus dysgalactiae]|uniref:hypothetical protein n=1 Tax=Streptococcus dysgalactiae TaxID=1334 RepID=UPI001950AE49
RLQAANETPIDTYGVKLLTLNLSPRREFPWMFVIAEVPLAILGIDFLEHFDLLVDSRRRALIDRTTGMHRLSTVSDCAAISPVIAIPTGRKPFAELIQEFSSLMRTANKLPAVSASVEHHIVTNGPPAHCHLRRLVPDILRAAKQEFDQML